MAHGVRARQLKPAGGIAGLRFLVMHADDLPPCFVMHATRFAAVGLLPVITATVLLALGQRTTYEVQTPAMDTLPVAAIEAASQAIVQRESREPWGWWFEDDPRCIGKVRTDFERLRACLERNGVGW
jgi:hypothetical protein